MASVSFRAKPETIFNMDGTPAYRRIKVPELKRGHCDMDAFRRHARFGAYANSDLFPSMLRRAVKSAGIGDYLRLDRPIPEGVSVDCSGFLAVVTIEIS